MSRGRNGSSGSKWKASADRPAPLQRSGHRSRASGQRAVLRSVPTPPFPTREGGTEAACHSGGANAVRYCEGEGCAHSQSAALPFPMCGATKGIGEVRVWVEECTPGG